MKDCSKLITQGSFEGKNPADEHRTKRTIARELNQINGVHCWFPCAGKNEGSDPDLLCCIDGKFIAYVIGEAGDEPNFYQRCMIRRVANAGGQVFRISSVQDAIHSIHVIRDEFWMYDEDQSRIWEEFPNG